MTKRKKQEKRKKGKKKINKFQEEADKGKKRKQKMWKDYDKIYNKRFEDQKDIKNLSREEIKKNNPELTEAQVDEMMSRQAEEKIGDTLFENNTTEPENEVTPQGFITNITNLKGEKKFKEFAKEVAEYISNNSQNYNHIPKFFSELLHALDDKIPTPKMINIVKDYEAKLTKRKKEENKDAEGDNKITKKSKNKGKK